MEKESKITEEVFWFALESAVYARGSVYVRACVRACVRVCVCVLSLLD